MSLWVPIKCRTIVPIVSRVHVKVGEDPAMFYSKQCCSYCETGIGVLDGGWGWVDFGVGNASFLSS